MRTKRIFSMFLTLILVVSIVFPGIKLTSYAQNRLYNPNTGEHLFISKR